MGRLQDFIEFYTLHCRREQDVMHIDTVDSPSSLPELVPESHLPMELL